MTTNLPTITDLTGAGVTEADFKTELAALFAALRECGYPLNGYGRTQNLGLAFSVGSNALTCALKQADGSTNADATNAAAVSVRGGSLTGGGYNARTVTGALSLVISSGSTLGHASAAASPVYWYLIDNSGTIELAASTKFFGLQGITTTTAEGGAGGADSATTMYSTTARVGVPFACVARTVDTQSTAGTWTAVPSEVHLFPFSARVVRLESAVTAAGADMPLSFDGDEDTGFFRPAANTIACVAGASEIWRATANHFKVNNSAATTHSIKDSSTSAGTQIMEVVDGNNRGVFVYAGADGTAFNAANTILGVRQATGTGRSINAAGTVNASAADYAEYETKADGCGAIAKGQIVGFDRSGLLTDKWADAVSFGVKSTNPAYVGGDTWGGAAGAMPEPPVKRRITAAPPAPPEGTGKRVIAAFETATQAYLAELDAAEAEHQAALAAYEKELPKWRARYEAARQRVDRIGYCGKLPCNVSGAKPGDYIVPVQDGTGIGGKPVPAETVSFAEYRIAVGQVRRVLGDDRAEIVVKAV